MLINVRLTPAHAGKIATQAAQIRRRGLTRAYAGKMISPLLLLLHEAHPRICGKDFRHRLRGVCPLGSPPRMRGRYQSILFGAVRTRLTPAYAGKMFLANYQEAYDGGLTHAHAGKIYCHIL